MRGAAAAVGPRREDARGLRAPVSRTSLRARPLCTVITPPRRGPTCPSNRRALLHGAGADVDPLALFSLPVPNDPRLLGLVLYAQVVNHAFTATGRPRLSNAVRTMVR